MSVVPYDRTHGLQAVRSTGPRRTGGQLLVMSIHRQRRKLKVTSITTTITITITISITAMSNAATIITGMMKAVRMVIGSHQIGGGGGLQSLDEEAQSVALLLGHAVRESLGVVGMDHRPP